MTYKNYLSSHKDAIEQPVTAESMAALVDEAREMTKGFDFTATISENTFYSGNTDALRHEPGKFANRLALMMDELADYNEDAEAQRVIKMIAIYDSVTS